MNFNNDPQNTLTVSTIWSGVDVSATLKSMETINRPYLPSFWLQPFKANCQRVTLLLSPAPPLPMMITTNTAMTLHGTTSLRRSHRYLMTRSTRSPLYLHTPLPGAYTLPYHCLPKAWHDSIYGVVRGCCQCILLYLTRHLHDSGIVETTGLCGRAPVVPGGFQEDLVPDLNRA